MSIRFGTLTTVRGDVRRVHVHHAQVHDPGDAIARTALGVGWPLGLPVLGQHQAPKVGIVPAGEEVLGHAIGEQDPVAVDGDVYCNRGRTSSIVSSRCTTAPFVTTSTSTVPSSGASAFPTAAVAVASASSASWTLVLPRMAVIRS